MNIAKFNLLKYIHYQTYGIGPSAYTEQGVEQSQQEKVWQYIVI